MLLFVPFISAYSITKSKATFKPAISKLAITNLTGRVVSHNT